MRCKTGALIRASVQLGALAPAPTPTRCDALDRYAHAVGLAFQVRDDILDVEGESRRDRQDRRQGRGRRQADLPLDPRPGRLARAAGPSSPTKRCDALAPLGDAASLLRELALYAAHRMH